jgi:hypothetical protein
MICRKVKMARIKMNNEYRTKISNIARNSFENNTFNSKRENYFQQLEKVKSEYPKHFDLARTIVQRAYPKEHCDTLQYFKTLYGSPCDVVAKDSCYYFAYTDEDSIDENGKPKENQKHFDFKLNGSLNGSEYNHDNDFAYAYFRQELKDNDLNADINIEQENNQQNPHLQKHTEANNNFLGLGNRSEDNTNLARDFNDQFTCDVIGTSYCRSRAIPCTKDEFSKMETFLIMKSKLVQTHQEWIRGIVEDTKDIKSALKSYRYLDEGIELANSTFKALSLNNSLIEESQIIRTNSTGLVMYNPQNVADRIAQRNEAKLTREEKIALYREQQQSNIN